ncbi:MAG: hypothetical protein IPN53_13275 [Comamonadaceae bacterium]|nr:hypothetical protein [Comamonadaceae bacterium]
MYIFDCQIWYAVLKATKPEPALTRICNALGISAASGGTKKLVVQPEISKTSNSQKLVRSKMLIFNGIFL